MLTELVRLHLELDPTNRVLVVCHRKEIIGQIASTILRSGIMDIGEILPGVTPRPACRVQVASTQTLRARNMRPHATLIIYDEAHHYSSDDWHELTKLYPGVLRIGFTATPMRSDGRGMSPAFDSLVVVSTIKELTRLGYLVPCRVIAPAVPIKKPSLSHSPVDAYLAHANGARTVVFADFIVNAEKFVAEFQEKGVRAVIVHGEMKDAERARAFAEHETGAVLVNCMVLTEGWDSPETKVCILARGCGSVGTYLQIVGRVLRPCSKCPSCAWSKANPSLERRGCERMALLIDLTGRSFYSHGAPDADRVYSLTGKGIRTSDTEADTPHCPVCGQPVEAPPNSWPCAVCGHEEEAGSQIEDPRYTGDELAERYAGKRTESDDKRIETLARWFAEAKSRADVNARKGDSWKWAAVAKYRAVYGDAPTNSIRMQAEALAQTLACVQCKECKKPAARTYQGGKCGGCAFKKRKG
jgi:superfamily II DNA or RNA helicase